MANKELVVGSIPRGKNEEIWIKVVDDEYVDIRIMFATEDGNWGYTKKGVRFHEEELERFITALQAAQEQINSGK